MPTYDLAMLDFDGTLADSAGSVVHCIQGTFRSRGEQPPTEAAIRATIGIPLPEALMLLRGHGTPAEGQDWAQTYRDIFLAEGMGRMRLFAGAAGFLSGLAERGVATVIVSARKAENTWVLLESFGLSHTVQEIYGYTNEGPNKPDPRLYQELIHPRFGRNEGHRAIMVGDTHIDLEFARAVGAHACWASYGYGDAGRCRGLRPEFTAAHPSELLGLF
ncbi:MAG: HAD family hydrolase [Desulfarculaceae bacterium]|nr:HAD family hydrolase [Desulfarculaceae bacterium]